MVIPFCFIFRESDAHNSEQRLWAQNSKRILHSYEQKYVNKIVCVGEKRQLLQNFHVVLLQSKKTSAIGLLVGTATVSVCGYSFRTWMNFSIFVCVELCAVLFLFSLSFCHCQPVQSCHARQCHRKIRKCQQNKQTKC